METTGCFLNFSLTEKFFPMIYREKYHVISSFNLKFTWKHRKLREKYEINITNKILKWLLFIKARVSHIVILWCVGVYLLIILLFFTYLSYKMENEEKFVMNPKQKR